VLFFSITNLTVNFSKRFHRMMLFPIVLSTLAFAATTLAAPAVTVNNNCLTNVYVTSVSKISGPTTEVLSKKSWTEAEYFNGVGTAIKITRTASGLYTGEPTLHLSYTYKQPEGIYYGLSTTVKYGFPGENITVTGDEGKGVLPILWNDKAQPNGTLYYAGETNLTLKLCA
jgi:hypothetical protein